MCSGHTQKELPPEIIQVIFSKLPLPNLPICRLVCKAWNDLVLDHASSTSKLVPNTFFMCKKTDDMHIGQPQPMQCIDLQTKHPGMVTSSFASFTFDRSWSFTFDRSWSKVGISNSCNGLLCIFEGGQECGTTPRAAILNPMTNEYFNLPPLPRAYKEVEKVIYFYGFGFGPKTKQYKIVRVSINWTANVKAVDVYTFGKKEKWRPICSKTHFMVSNGVYFDGGIYWLGDNKMSNVIIRFDVENEKFKTITLPRDARYLRLSFGVFNDRLYATFCKCPCYRVEVWMMLSNGAGESWILEFVFECIPREPRDRDFPWQYPYRGRLQLIKTFEDGEILGLVDKLYFFLYNPKTGMTKALNKTDGRALWVHQMDSYTLDSLQKILTPNGGFRN